MGNDFRAAGDGDVAAAAHTAAADAGTFIAAGGLQAAVGLISIGDGEIAVTAAGIVVRRGNGVLLHTGVIKTALDGIAPVQLDDHVAVALDFNGSTAGFNVHTAECDIGGGTGISIDGDGVGGGRSFTVSLFDDGFCRLLYVFDVIGLLGDILPAVIGGDSDAAVCKVIFLRKGRQGQAANQQQGHDQGREPTAKAASVC